MAQQHSKLKVQKKVQNKQRDPKHYGEGRQTQEDNSLQYPRKLKKLKIYT